MICGAGGGGFLQVILKKGVTKQALIDRLDSVFSGSGVEVWDSEFYI
jgi:fucokinase